ncbi:hypothetical protein OG196_14030 [Kitasatospora purpeofusca]|uniref:hypothetical protein n=1 Tax=Kitasatospora purpeofusca TaxID=67352 RepID=UPI002E11B969|nr:hypothetical protein OG196_14030 [Kitasatospora purpeofusca]
MYTATIDELADWLAKDARNTAEVAVDDGALVLTPRTRGGATWDAKIHMTVTARPGGGLVTFTCTGPAGGVLHAARTAFEHHGPDDALRQLKIELLYFRAFGHEDDPEYRID